MNYSTAVMLINANIRAVSAQYEETGKVEVFKTLLHDLKKDDIVVVESGTRWKFTTVKVTDVENVQVDFDSDKLVKWIVQKVDTAPHDAVKDMEAKAIDVIKAGELRKRREDIRKNTLDAVAAGEIDGLEIAKLSGTPQIEAAKVA